MELLTQSFWKLSSIWIICNANVASYILDIYTYILGKIAYADIVNRELRRTVFTKVNFVNLQTVD